MTTNSGEHTLYIVTLLIFGAFGPPGIYVLWRHGRHGILGWLYLQLLVFVRVIGSIVELKAISNNTTNSTAVMIVNSVGLSPLILAALGIMHEARRARNPNIRKKLEWFLVINLHVVVSIALILVVIGIVHCENNNTSPQDSHVIKIGLVVVFLCYTTLFAWALYSLRGHKYTDPLFYAKGSGLLKGVIFSMPFIGCRVLYGILTFSIKNDSFANSLGWKIFLSVVPEVIVVTMLTLIGILTRNMYRERQAAAKVEAYPQQQQQQRPPYGAAQQRYPGQGRGY